MSLSRRMGEFTCVVHAGAHVREATAHTLEQLAATAAVDGYRDFVFDLTRVGRYETPALRSVADLWRRLSGLDCEVFVAARNPGVVDCLHRVIPARGKWTLQPTVADALRALLARPGPTPDRAPDSRPGDGTCSIAPRRDRARPVAGPRIWCAVGRRTRAGEERAQGVGHRAGCSPPLAPAPGWAQVTGGSTTPGLRAATKTSQSSPAAARGRRPIAAPASRIAPRG